MKIDEAIKVLELHNEWRKGAEIAPDTPVRIGMAIDLVTCELKTLRQGAVSTHLFAITTQEGWIEMFWDKDKAQRKIDTEYKKDFPNEEFWIEEVHVS